MERDGPLLSVLVPVLDPAPEQLAALARSVLDQRVRRELVLVDAGCRTAPVLRLLAELGRRPDVRVVRVDEDSGRLLGAADERAVTGISAATNAGARAATGEVLLFLDHDDLLAEGILARVARAFAEDPSLDLLSTDEDQLTRDGQHVAPVFRPGPSPWLLLGFNAATHLLAVRAALFAGLGGLRPECDGAQDHDLLLRAWERARRVGHLHAIGYHWRRAPGSVSDSSTNKPWAFDAGLRAVRDALARRGVPAEVVGHGEPRGVYDWRPCEDAGGEGISPRFAPTVVLVGGEQERGAWQASLVAWPGDVVSGCWPERLPPDGLCVVDADALLPDASALSALRPWTRLAAAGVGGVACAAQHAGRRAHLGFTLTRDGWAEAIQPGLRVGCAGPALLAAAPREVATSAAGVLWLAHVPDDVLACLAHAPTCRADVLVLGLLPACVGACTLFVPALLPTARGPSPRAARSIDLEASPAWPSVRAHLPESLWAGGADRFCPRHELLVPLGLPAPTVDLADLSRAARYAGASPSSQTTV